MLHSVKRQHLIKQWWLDRVNAIVVVVNGQSGGGGDRRSGVTSASVIIYTS
jgi:hypothetical protein